MIKKYVVTVLLLFCAMATYAQDVIVRKNGEVLNVYNVEIASKYIFYTTEESSDDIKKVAKEDIFSVKIGDGEMQMVGETVKEAPKPIDEAPKSTEPIEGLIERKTADNNAELIARYNKRHDGFTDKQPSDKVAKDGYAILGVTKESVLSNEDIVVELVCLTEQEFKQSYEPKIGYCDCGWYYIYIKNKTNNTLYIDLGNTFRVYNNGKSKVYFDGSTISESIGSSSGASMNLGAVIGALGVGGIAGTLASGVNVGGGSQNSVSKTYGSQRILAIPPMGKVSLPPYYRKGFGGWGDKKVIAEYDTFPIFYPEKHEGIMRKHGVTDFTEEETPWKNQFMITYSFEQTFKGYSNIKFSLYLKQLIGNIRFIKVKDMNKKIKDFDEYTLIGTFNLNKKVNEIIP